MMHSKKQHKPLWWIIWIFFTTRECSALLYTNKLIYLSTLYLKSYVQLLFYISI